MYIRIYRFVHTRIYRQIDRMGLCEDLIYGHAWNMEERCCLLLAPVGDTDKRIRHCSSQDSFTLAAIAVREGLHCGNLRLTSEPRQVKP